MLSLRKPCAADQTALAKLFDQSRDLHQPWAYPPSDLAAFIADDHVYLVCADADDNIVGYFHISGIVRGYFQSAYLGYAVFEPFQHRGYMTEGIQLLIDEAFGALKLHRLEANIQPGNTASIKLVQNAGFAKEGFSKQYLNIGGKGWKDHERWALINGRWQP